MQANFAAIEKQSEADFTSLVEAAFTPGNSEFSGNLPRLVTENESLWKLYHNGFANLLVRASRLTRLGVRARRISR